MSQTLKGLYLITPPLPEQPHDDEIYLQSIADALSGGVRLLQFRDKSTDSARRQTMAITLLELCQARSITFVINDDVDLTLAVGAHGVHLGKSDIDLATARRRLGGEAIIGVSCYNRLALAQMAEIQGADYVAFGRFFPSQTKPNAVQAPLSLLSEAKRLLRTPLVAIGGITANNAGQLVEAGADMVAVIEWVFGQQDRHGAAQAITDIFALDAG